MNALTTGSALVPQDMNGAMQLANMMSRGKLVPQHLRDSPGDCLLVIEQAMRWGMSPFAVAQCTSVIQGKLMFEGKLVAAALNTCGLMEHRLREKFEGEGPSRAIILTGTIQGETDPRTIRVTLAEAKTSNGMWVKQPDQQLVYFATRAWARRHAPEVMLGVYSPEEFDEPKRDTFKGTTIDAKPEARAQPEPTHDEPRKLTVTEWLKQLDADLANARDGEELDAILAREDVNKAQDQLRNGARDRLRHMLDTTIQRVQAMESSAPSDADREDEAPPANANPDTLPARADAFLATIGRLNKDTLPNLLKRQDYKDFVGELTVADRNDLLVRVRDATQAAQAKEAG